MRTGDVMSPIGKKIWLIPDCYYPELSTAGPYISHESLCVLNVSEIDANLNLTAYYEEQEPDGGFFAVCSAHRTNHIRLDKLRNDCGKSIEKGVPYALLIESDIPVVCQYSRVDTTQERLGLATTMAYSQ